MPSDQAPALNAGQLGLICALTQIRQDVPAARLSAPTRPRD